jgi:hypothetical protein
MRCRGSRAAAGARLFRGPRAVGAIRNRTAPAYRRLHLPTAPDHSDRFPRASRRAIQPAPRPRARPYAHSEPSRAPAGGSGAPARAHRRRPPRHARARAAPRRAGDDGAWTGPAAAAAIRVPGLRQRRAWRGGTGRVAPGLPRPPPTTPGVHAPRVSHSLPRPPSPVKTAPGDLDAPPRACDQGAAAAPPRPAKAAPAAAGPVCAAPAGPAAAARASDGASSSASSLDSSLLLDSGSLLGAKEASSCGGDDGGESADCAGRGRAPAGGRDQDGGVEAEIILNGKVGRREGAAGGGVGGGILGLP